MSTRPKRSLRPLWVGAALALVLLTSLGLYSEASISGWRKAHPELAEAEWIWAENAQSGGGPVSFLVYRDFELDRVPDTAELLCQGDEEFLVLVNGQFVGSGRYYEGESVHRYEVAELLREGTNRIIVELRSSRGLGGFLGGLSVGDGSEPVVTNAQWKILRRWRPGLLSGKVFPGARTVRSWGRVPVGRWGRPVVGPLLPSLRDLKLPIRDLPPAQFGRWKQAAGWQMEPWALWRQAADHSTDEGLLLDWGQPVAGYLTIEHHLPAEVQPLAVLAVGLEAPERGSWVANEFLIGVSGAPLWASARPHRFRYVLIEGSVDVASVRLVPIDGDRASAVLARPGLEAKGVFGLASPRSRSSMENEVRSRLKSVSGATGGEEL